MKIATSALVFAFPDDWVAERRDGRLFVRGVNREELILSGSQTLGEGDESERDPIVQRVLQNAINAITQTLKNPELRITEKLTRKMSSGQVTHFKAFAETTDSATLFVQAAFASKASVVLLTFEAPNTASSLAAINNILESVAEA